MAISAVLGVTQIFLSLMGCLKESVKFRTWEGAIFPCIFAGPKLVVGFSLDPRKLSYYTLWCPEILRLTKKKITPIFIGFWGGFTLLSTAFLKIFVQLPKRSLQRRKVQQVNSLYSWTKLEWSNAQGEETLLRSRLLGNLISGRNLRLSNFVGVKVSWVKNTCDTNVLRTS